MHHYILLSTLLKCYLYTAIQFWFNTALEVIRNLGTIALIIWLERSKITLTNNNVKYVLTAAYKVWLCVYETAAQKQQKTQKFSCCLVLVNKILMSLLITKNNFTLLLLLTHVVVAHINPAVIACLFNSRWWWNL